MILRILRGLPARWHYTTREQRKLLLSLGTNCLTRIPGAIGLLWFLPLLHRGLGTDNYATLLSALALGSTVAFLATGINMVGRRMIGEAYSNVNRKQEADSFVSLVLANLLAFAASLMAVSLYFWLHHDDITVCVVTTLMAAMLVLSMFDDARLAYNEHYVSAILLTLLQCVFYTIGFLVPALRQHVITGALVLQAAYFCTSLTTAGLLIWRRPYLLKGRPIAVWLMLRQGLQLAVADGFLLATLSLSVVWLQATASGDVAAWFATIVRLFQTFLVPVILMLLPMTGYIRIRWNGKSMAARQIFTKLTLALALIYGGLVAILLLIASHLYVGHLLHLPVPDNITVFALFGAIVAYKSYSSVAYIVLDSEAAHLSSGTTIAVGIAVLCGAVASQIANPLAAISVYAVTAACGIVVVLVWNAVRALRSTSMGAVKCVLDSSGVVQ